MKVSIITATYNSASTIRQTLESVLGQTHKDIDYWIIDGGSKDETISIVKEYESQFGGRLNWISEPDKGIYDAMNKGIRRATGDIIGILNSDDYYTSDDSLQCIVDAFSADTELQATYGDIHFVHDNNPDKCVRYYSSSKFRPALLRFGYIPAHPSFYVRKSVYEDYGYYSVDYKIASDYDMMVRLFYKHKIRAKYIHKDFVTMRTGGMSNASIANRILTTREDVKACRTYGMFTCFSMICCKYFTKIFEFL